MDTWTTKEGKEIELKDLTDDHLKNIINKRWRDVLKVQEYYIDAICSTLEFQHTLSFDPEDDNYREDLPFIPMKLSRVAMAREISFDHVAMFESDWDGIWTAIRQEALNRGFSLYDHPYYSRKED